MYLRKSNGPRMVILPGGSILSLADLPPVNTRWVASRKATVVNAVEYGLLSRDEVIERYNLSNEEFDSWCDAIKKHGIGALKVTTIQKFKNS